ncbi:N-acetyl-gamma-glutamyl-phosphate reductase, partial [Candidatus Woesearchaeota archaeon CG_4_10_14_0_2_um_filter_57_5]
NLDLVFVAVSHGDSMAMVKELHDTNPKLKIIDLGADFRLTPERFEQTYKQQHCCPDIKAVPGLPELNAEAIKHATIVANPGCFANTAILGLAPIAAHILPTVQVTAITGSSGSGAQPKQATHHPERDGNVAAYMILSHRHVPEIEQALNDVVQSVPQSPDSQPQPFAIQLVPQSGPYARGILATCFATLKDPSVDAKKLYQEWADPTTRPFVRIRDDSPKLSDVRGSNFIDIAVHQQGNTVVILSALDNMVKGAAGNAVQCMNLMLKLPETTGLLQAPLSP